MINILIRTSNRPEEFKRCIDSIVNQTFKDVHLIVSEDVDESLTRTLETLIDSKLSYEIIKLQSSGVPFQWNFYCNNLKDRVHTGWFFYLDDDDFLVDNHCLKQITTHLTYPYQAVICQFMRGTKAKPDYRQAFGMKPEHIIRGRIGGSCIFLHHSQKNVANWDGQKAADYRFIRDVAKKIPMVFVPIPVVQAGNNGRHGK
jgi:glycosyltransferase involved in cell wall biosynthesis